MPGGIDHREPQPGRDDPSQLELPFPKVERGVSFLRHGARRFAERNGRTYSAEGLDQVQAQSQFQRRVANVYDQTPVYAGDKRAQRSYAALRDETHQQYEYMTKPRSQGGLGIKHEVVAEDPYKTREEMQDDILKNRRLKTLATASTGGKPHALLDEETNDRFRAVHDAFGHAAIGRSFSRHGEEAAFHSHRQMYSPEAHRALATETRAQNSFLNYGPTGRFADEQKPILMPDWIANRTHPAAQRRQFG